AASGLIKWTPTTAQALSASSASFSVTATNYAGSSTFSVSVPLLTLAPPTNLTYTANRIGGTVLASWSPSAISALPVATYQVVLRYVYYTYSGGRGGHSVAHRGGWAINVPAGTHSALFTAIPFASLPGGTLFTLSVWAVDTAGTASPTTSVRFH